MSRPTLILLAALAVACGAAPKTPTAVQHMTPMSEILNVGKIWESRASGSAIRDPRSAVGIHTSKLLSRVTFDTRGRAEEELISEESFKLKEGANVRCHAQARVALRAHFGRKADESVVQLESPELALDRTCDAAHPAIDTALTLPPRVARFALRGDRLIAIEPRLEKRLYIPVD